MQFRYVIVLSPMLIVLALFSSRSIGSGSQTASISKIDPADIETISKSDYKWKTRVHIARGEKEEALATCLAMIEVSDEGSSRTCQKGVYREFEDIDNQIRLYEKDLEIELATGEDTYATEYTLKGLRERREKQK